VDHDQQLTSVLADGTRYRIYRSIVDHSTEAVTVTDVATSFGLHPNVARMHLTKLEQAGLLVTSLRKGPGGGRPAKLYRMSDQVATLSIPARRYDALSRLALASLNEANDMDAVRRACHKAGVDAGRNYLVEHHGAASVDHSALVSMVTAIAEDFGLLPEVGWDGDMFTVDVHNCAFKELSTGDPDLVCTIHQSFLGGLFEALGGADGAPKIVADSAISRGDDRCRLRVAFS
jgi:predicted ArsR family transcriptional regulator